MWTEITDLVVLGRNYWSSGRVCVGMFVVITVITVAIRVDHLDLTLSAHLSAKKCVDSLILSTDEHHLSVERIDYKNVLIVLKHI